MALPLYVLYISALRFVPATKGMSMSCNMQGRKLLPRSFSKLGMSRHVLDQLHVVELFFGGVTNYGYDTSSVPTSRKMVVAHMLCAPELHREKQSDQRELQEITRLSFAVYTVPAWAPPLRICRVHTRSSRKVGPAGPKPNSS